MIQRLQTLFLCLALSCSFLLLFFIPFFSSENMYVVNEPILSFLVFLSIFLGFLSIFLFKKRDIQIKFCLLSLMIKYILLVVQLILILDNNILLENFLGIFVIFLSIIQYHLAIKYIKKDESLIRGEGFIR